MTQNWKWQDEAFEFAREKSGALLAMAMGTGKSRVAIKLIEHDKANRILIVCPKSVISVWPSEFAIHGNGEITVYPFTAGSVSSKTARLDYALYRPRTALVINYESVWRPPLGKHLLGKSWDCLILDESHRIKAPGGRASRYIHQLAKRSRRRLALTGTPMPHTFLDIYAQYRAIDSRIYGTSFNSFKTRYGVWGGYGGYELRGIQNKEEFNRLFYSIAYRVGNDVLGLPETLHIVRTCALEPSVRDMYDTLRKEFIADVLNGTVTAANALTRLLRLAQITSGFIKNDDGVIVPLGQEKYDLMVDTIQDTDADEAWVIFCRFRHDLDMVHKAAAALGRRSLELSGRVNQVTEWQLGRAPILAAQIKAGSLGLNLTRARYCGYYSVGFSLGEYSQSLARTHRPGQTRPVIYYHWVAENTVDNQIWGALERKEDIIESIIREITGEQQIIKAVC